MASTLAELFRHNLWANLRLLDACAGLSEAQLDLTAPGTYGRVRDTVVHLVSAEGRYVGLLRGERPEQPVHESKPWPGAAAVREQAQLSGETLVRIAEEDQAEQTLRGTRGDRPYEMSARVPLVQAINHATEHRAHVVAILTQNGVEVPSLDGWAYSDQAGLIKSG
jgi:uncharacterized damage-inducible protein DinB